MGYKEFREEENRETEERYALVMERIGRIPEDNTVPERFRSYFLTAADYILLVHSIAQQVETGTYFDQPLERLEEDNRRLFADILPENYEKSYGNPSYAALKLGAEYGGILCALLAELHSMSGYAMEQDRYLLTIYAELFVEIYNCFEEPETLTMEEITRIFYWFHHDYSEVFLARSIRRQVDPSDDFFQEIVRKADLEDPRYLYRYGCYIGENERKMAAFLCRMSQDEIQKMADTYTEGYRIGFEVTKKDLSKKKTAEIYYPVGFERMVRAAVGNLERLGLSATMRRGNGRIGVNASPANPQFDYDHKSDAALYLDKAYVERRLSCLRTIWESQKDLAAGYAGPAVIETFGQEPFAPASKPEAIEYDKKQQQLSVYLASEAGQIINQYIRGEERSFTIIAYPVPEIGARFEEIFAKTVELNNLDYTTYQKIQQKLIDVLDQASTVEIRGKGANRTDLVVAIHPLKDPAKETAFENCVADVNIPVGEVFTSPRLSGTNGLLHVTSVYLNGLEYRDLALTFTDGMISAYRCGNFDTEEGNTRFLKENLLFRHETLPMGEFAIGTNTTAYRMGKTYHIESRLPILIAEKTGPHFAVGDTCYSYAEDVPVFNPDGKEIIARDNEVTLARRSDPQKAYFHCHTDITIPFDELGSIVAVTKDGTRLPIILDGRFVVKGTEELNRPLE